MKDKTPTQLAELLEKYHNGTLSPAERELVDDWLEELGEHKRASLLSEPEKAEIKSNLLKFIREKETEPSPGLTEKPYARGRSLSRTFYRIAAAVLIVAIAGYGAYVLQSEKIDNTEVAQVVDLNPGSDKAYLTLADGTRIELNGSGTPIPKQGSAQIESQSGKLVYVRRADESAVASAKEETSAMEGVPAQDLSKAHLIYNSVSTPRGGQYQVSLSDGSAVWLNAASSLRYPVAFDHIERIVELTGEAYFEIAKDAGRPFKVKIVPSAPREEAVVEVLGTHFSVTAYADEVNINTTLLEGSVRISSSQNHTVILKPGEKNQITRANGSMQVLEADLEEAVAWKNGYFLFNSEDVHSIMRKISRWYDVEIEYSARLQDKRFTGSISRFEHVSEVLTMLELTTSVHFTIEGRKIKVTP